MTVPHDPPHPAPNGITRDPPDSRSADAESAWAEYTALARRLGEVRAIADAEALRRQQTNQHLSSGLGEINARLATQASALTADAARLHFPHPLLHPRGPAEITSPEEGLREAIRHTGEADVAMSRLEELAYLPGLLPYAPTRIRNAAVYGACALVGVIAQWVLILLGPDTAGADAFTVAAWSLCGLPTVAFFAGWSTVGLAAKPRLEKTPESFDAPATNPLVARTPWMGALICYAALPVSWVLVTLLHDMLTGWI